MNEWLQYVRIASSSHFVHIVQEYDKPYGNVWCGRAFKSRKGVKDNPGTAKICATCKKWSNKNG